VADVPSGPSLDSNPHYANLIKKSLNSTDFHHNTVKLGAAVMEVVIARVLQYQRELGHKRQQYKHSHLVYRRYFIRIR
jgi:hypothetical protein